jgi:DNA-binding LytR/AlgR family response regulator
VGYFTTAADAAIYLATHTVDILFLDIQLGGMSGLQLLEQARPSGAVILTTAFDMYALQGFDLAVTDYLLKPFTFERFLQAVTKAEERLCKREVLTTQSVEAIFIKTEYRLEKVALADLLFIEGMRDYRRLHLRDKKIMTLQSFGQLEAMIPPTVACRVHKSFMVALDKIDRIERDRIRIGTTIIPISDTYKRLFLARILPTLPSK